jgi:hypothetical protein
MPLGRMGNYASFKIKYALTSTFALELVRLYSNLHRSANRLCQLNRDALSQGRSRPDPAPLVPQRVERRLGPDLIKRVVSEYASGISTTRLAMRYGLGKGTLLRLIRDRGVTIRGRGPVRRGTDR